MADWSFLTKHAQALACIAHDPEVRLRDIATRLGITERTAYGIVTDLANAGYVVKDREGRRNRYLIQAHLPLQQPSPGTRRSARCWTDWSTRRPNGERSRVDGLTFHGLTAARLPRSH